ncbi:MAG TPA: hypothetical protein VJ047_18515 [Pseudomonas sp.]|nr:hypothetical protein [Pseudomonas sp.]
MTIRFYSSLDTGAPVLSGNFYDRLRTILMACLVEGYGSKPGAGWSVVHDVTNGFSLSNGDGVINFVYQTVYDVRVYIMESVTDGSTALAGGVNRRSAAWYDGSAVTERFNLYGAHLGVGSNPHWVVVADDKSCIWAGGGNTATADMATGTSFANYFGNYINALGLSGAAQFCCLGGNNSAGGSAQRLGYGDGRYGMALRNPFTGLIEQGVDARYGASAPIHTRGGTSWFVTSVPLIKTTRLIPVRAGLMCYGAGLNGTTSPPSQALAGYLRGLIVEPVLCGALLSQVLGFFSLPNEWQGRAQAINLPAGPSWVPVFPASNDAGFFASLDPADWE